MNDVDLEMSVDYFWEDWVGLPSLRRVALAGVEMLRLEDQLSASLIRGNFPALEFVVGESIYKLTCVSVSNNTIVLTIDC
jgi:hypothetical protein